jgi:RND family efflux transporter MFP subunit
MIRKAGFPLIFVSAGALMLGACGGSSAEPTGTTAEIKAAPVRVAAAAPAEFLNDIAAIGRVEPDRSFILAFKTAGVVRAIAVDEGDAVKKGQVLAELDPKDVDAQLRQAQESADKASRDLSRVKKLHANGFASEAALQDAQMLADQSRANATAARANRGYASIVAPNDGVVLKRHIESNGVVAAGAPVLTISDLTQSYVLAAGLADKDAVRVALGDAASVSFDAFPGTAFPAVISEIAADADPRTGTFAIKLKLAAGPDTLRSGLVGRASIRPAKQAGRALAVPVDAILEGHGRDAFVFVVDAAGAAHRTRIQVGRLSGGLVAVTGGLSEGARVVVDGAGYLTDGEKVSVATVSAE